MDKHQPLNGKNFMPAGTYHGDNEVLLIKLKGDDSLSNTEIDNEKHLKVVPNPSDGIFNIYHLFNNSSIAVYSLTGQLIKNLKNISGKSYSIDISDKPAGTYIIKIDNSVSYKLIKK